MLNCEIHLIGRSNRLCFAPIIFRSVDQADSYRGSVLRSLLLFTLSSNIVSILLFYYKASNHATIAASSFEAIICAGAIHNLVSFCYCLSDGVIAEYQPIHKMFPVLLITLIPMLQPPLVHFFADYGLVMASVEMVVTLWLI